MHDIQRILMTTDTMGGVWTYALELCRAWRVRGIRVMLATMGPLPDADQRRQIAQLGNVCLCQSSYDLEWMDDPWEDVERAGHWLLDLEQQFQPDLVHLNGYVHGNLRRSAPAMIVAHSCVLSWWEAVKHEPAPVKYARYRAEVNRGLNAAREIVAPSGAMGAAVLKHYTPVAPITVIANGRGRLSYRPGAKEPVILTAGRLWDQAKNLAALEAAADNIVWPIFAAGAGGQAGRKIQSLGKLSDEQLVQWYGRASIYALPARYEPFGLSVLEAAMSGCALVLGDIPSLRENWSGAAAFVPPDDAEGLASVLNRLIRDEGRRRSLGRLAIERSLNFSATKMAEQYMAVYQRAVARTPVARTELDLRSGAMA